MSALPCQRPPVEQLLDAIVEAADLALDETEYDIALESIALVALDYDDDARIPADWLVTEIEKDIGLGLDERRYAAAVAATRAWLQQSVWRVPEPAPDAHLKAAYEDHFALANA